MIARVLAVLLFCVSCGKTTPIKTTATANKNLSLSGIGTLSTKLEIRNAGADSLAVAWFTWSGSDTVTIASTVTLYRFDTNKLAELESQESAFDLDSGASKAVSTETSTETRRRCASIAVTATAFNSNGDEKSSSVNAQVCERS